jgi:predicted metalloprotease
MRWTRGGRSSNIEDLRGQGMGGGGFGGGGFGGRGGMRLGLGGTVILFLLSMFFGRDFFSLVGVDPAAPTATSGGGDARSLAREEPEVEFVSFVLDDAQLTWSRILPEYQEAKLVLFRDAVQSACGFAQAASGPFYCPGDQKVYLDLSFFEELRSRFGAAGDFAKAYVIAHEIGHHVQHVLGIEQKVRHLQRQNSSQGNALSVRLELQADCLAGVWGHSTAKRDILETGDVEAGLNAAAAIGDDRLTRGRVSPESFTHGTSAQRVSWFRRGLESGQTRNCDTFARE